MTGNQHRLLPCVFTPGSMVPPLPLQRAGTRRERVGLNAHLVEHIDEQVAQRRIIPSVVGNVLAVSVSATGKNDWKIRRVMSVRVAQIAAEQNGCVIQQPISLRRSLSKLRQEVRKCREDSGFDDLQLGNPGGVLSMMRQRVMLAVDTGDVWHAVVSVNHQADHAR